MTPVLNFVRICWRNTLTYLFFMIICNKKRLISSFVADLSSWRDPYLQLSGCVVTRLATGHRTLTYCRVSLRCCSALSMFRTNKVNNTTIWEWETWNGKLLKDPFIVKDKALQQIDNNFHSIFSLLHFQSKVYRADSLEGVPWTAQTLKWEILDCS